MLSTLLICQFSVCFAVNNPDPNDSSKYLEAVREFADNVLKYGRDTYGPKHTPFFVDGLNIHTHEPVKWIAPRGIQVIAVEDGPAASRVTLLVDEKQAELLQSAVERGGIELRRPL